MNRNQSPSQPLIEQYALLADTHSAALVSNLGSIDWLCWPRFDSPALFAAILDYEHGGSWSIAPVQEPIEVTRAYRKDSMVLETVMRTKEGTVKVLDCLGVEETRDRDPRHVHPDELLVRTVDVTAGSVDLQMRFAPRFGYGTSFRGSGPWTKAGRPSPARMRSI